MTEDEPAWKLAARAHLDEARKRNGRVGARKSRDGCLTCKQRRVKCDETRPTCHRCDSSGRSCGGYLTTAASPRTPDQYPCLTDLTRSLAQSSNLKNDQERRAFDFYITVSAPHINGSEDKDFWFGQVLRLARIEPVVMDSLLAISVLYEHPQYLRSFRGTDASQTQSPNLRTPPPEPLITHHATALTRYNRALRTFQQQLTLGKATPQLAMVTCILFVCIEMLRDDVGAAMALIKHGSAIIGRSSGLKLPVADMAHSDAVMIIFFRMTELVGTFGLHLSKPLLPQPAVPAFRSLAEARSALRLIVGESQALLKETAALAHTVPIMQAMFEDDICGPWSSPRREGKELLGRTLNGFGMTGTFSSLEHFPTTFDARRQNQKGDDQPMTSPHPSVEPAMSAEDRARMARLATMNEQQQHLEHRLGAWHQAFDTLPSATTQSEVEISCSAMMYFHNSYLLLATRTATDQTVFDQHTHHFSAILEHAHILIESRGGRPPAFTLDVALVPSLYFVATLCRVPSLRRRALQLMARAPRKEGVFGATSTAELCACLIAIEEQDLGLPPPDWDGSSSLSSSAPEDRARLDAVLPAEHRRVAGWALLRSMPANAYEVRAVRFREVEGALVKDVAHYPIQPPAMGAGEVGGERTRRGG